MKTIITFLFISLQLAVNAQTLFQTVRGNLLDKDNNSPLIGATILVLNTDPLIGTTTDVNGEFQISKVPVGRQSIKISSIGYKEIKLNNIEINSGKETVLKLVMEETVNNLAEVVISANQNKTQSTNEMNAISARTFSVEETSRYAGSRNDVSRMASNYAGVNTGDDSRNDIIIRGNSPTGLLWRLEGLDIPSPNHFSGVGSNGGPVSMLNYNVISNSDFMTSAFSAEYGNAISGVFDIEMRNGNNEKREQMFQFGALGTELMVEGPFSKKYKGSYLINYRFSTTTILTKMGIDFGFNGQADYQDLSFKFSLPAGKFGTFEMFGLNGKSAYKIMNDQKKEDSFDYSITDNSNNDYKTQINVFGISHLLRLSNNSFLKTIIGFSGSVENGNIDSISLPDKEIIPYYRTASYDNKISVHSFIKTKISAKDKLKIGVIADSKRFNINEKMYDYNLQGLKPYRSGSNTVEFLQLYMQLKHSFNDDLFVNAGFHYQQFFLNNAKALEPRLALNWNIDKSQTMSLGYGLHSQMQILPVYFVNSTFGNEVYNTNKNLGFNKSQHFVLGYSNMLAKHTALKIESYYQGLFNLPVTASNHPSSFSCVNEGGSWTFTDRDSLVNNGTGRNIGIEMTVEKFLHKGYYYLFTASVFDSKYKGSDGIFRNTAFNGNYVLNVLAGKEFKITSNSKIIADLKVSTAGGRRYTPIYLDLSRLAGAAVYNDNEAFSKQHKNYFRTDLKITYRINALGLTHEVFLNIDNVFNNKNVYGQIYSKKTNNLEYIYQLGLFPTFQYKILF